MQLNQETIEMVYEELERATADYQIAAKVLTQAVDVKDRAFQLGLASGQIEGKNDGIRQGVFGQLYPELVTEVQMAAHSEVDAANHLALVKIRVEKLRAIIRFEELSKPS